MWTPTAHFAYGLMLLVIAGLSCVSGLQTVKQWKLLNFNFLPNAPITDVNFYNPTNVLITGIAVSEDRIFVATPKLLSGVPTAISYVAKSEFGDSPVLKAYPDWSFSTTARTDFNCSDLVLVSAYRLRIDTCNRLWVLDAGISRSLEDYQVTCPPKILVIDLRTDQVVRRIDFPREILRGETLFTNMVIDETTAKNGNCDDVFIYISDTVEPAIVVYDSGRDVTWRLSHPAMYPDPDFAQSEILGDRFILMDGVVGLTFDPRTGIVYFQPLATDRVFSVHKDVLRAGPLPLNQVLQVKLVGKKSSQGIGMAVSPVDGSLIFSPLSETAVASWNPNTNQQSVLAFDVDKLQFVADITTVHSEPGVIYMVSSKFHRFFLKNLNAGEYNNRILRIELPGEHAYTPPHELTTTTLERLPAYTLTSLLAAGLPHFGNIQRETPSLKTAPTASHYFSSNSKQPYHGGTSSISTLEGPGHNMLGYTQRNPFFTLNRGESFPPRKALRNLAQNSFLENLPQVTTTSGVQLHPATHNDLSSSQSYYYNQVSHILKREDVPTKTIRP